MTTIDTYDTLSDVKDVDDIMSLIVSPFAHLSAHMYGVGVTGRCRGPPTPLTSQGPEAIESWGRSVPIGEGALAYVRFWPKGAIQEYPTPTTAMIVAIRVEHIRIHGENTTTSVVSSVAMLLPVAHFEVEETRTRIRDRDAPMCIPTSLHLHMPAKDGICDAGTLIERAHLAVQTSLLEENDSPNHTTLAGSALEKLRDIHKLREDFRTGFLPLRGKMSLVMSRSARGGRSASSVFELDERSLAASTMASLLGRQLPQDMKGPIDHDRDANRTRETSSEWKKARFDEGATISGFCAEVGCPEVPLHLATTEVLGLFDLSSILALHSIGATRDALPRAFKTIRGYPLLLAAALRMACAPTIYDMDPSPSTHDDGCAELTERFVAQWRPVVPQAAGNALFAIDVVILKAIADANAQTQEGIHSTGTESINAPPVARPVGVHRGSSRSWSPRVIANLNALARSGHRIIEAVFTQSAFVAANDVESSDALYVSASLADDPLAMDVIRASRRPLMPKVGTTAFATSVQTQSNNRRESPWPFIALPPDVGRDAVVTLLDDVERYCRRSAGYSTVDGDGNDGVDGVRGDDDESEDDDVVQGSACELSRRMQEAYLCAARGENLLPEASKSLTIVMAQHDILSHNDPFRGSAPIVSSLSQPLGDRFLAASLAQGTADVAASVGLTSHVISPHSITECFSCHESIFGLEALLPLPYGQCRECERFRCFRCVKATPRPEDLRCAHCKTILDDIH